MGFVTKHRASPSPSVSYGLREDVESDDEGEVGQPLASTSAAAAGPAGVSHPSPLEQVITQVQDRLAMALKVSWL